MGLNSALIAAKRIEEICDADAGSGNATIFTRNDIEEIAVEFRRLAEKYQELRDFLDNQKLRIDDALVNG